MPNELVVAAKQKQELLTQVTSEMNPALLAETQAIKLIYVTESKRSVVKLWEIGEKLRKVRDNEDKYGLDPIPKIAAVLGYGSRSSIDKALQLNRSFDKPSLDKLLNMRTKIGDAPLSRAHFEALTALPDVKDRLRLAEKACELDMTADDLVKEVRKDMDKPKRGGGGRQVNSFAGNPAARLSDLGKMLHMIDIKSTQSFLAQGTNFVDSLATMSTEKITPEFIQDLGEKIEQASKADDLIRKIRFNLEEARRTAEDILQKHAREEGEKAAEAISAGPAVSTKADIVVGKDRKISFSTVK
jgi:polyhydroxyalkanoate synthesis regulator phasin